jgi:hypothetical protein
MFLFSLFLCGEMESRGVLQELWIKYDDVIGSFHHGWEYDSDGGIRANETGHMPQIKVMEFERGDSWLEIEL